MAMEPMFDARRTVLVREFTPDGRRFRLVEVEIVTARVVRVLEEGER